jgi:hypothetical protein
MTLMKKVLSCRCVRQGSVVQKMDSRERGKMAGEMKRHAR